MEQTHTGANLRPKEHGAYAMLAIPIITALAIAGWSLPGLGIAVASIAGFLSHEPVLVAWGHRGRRAQRTTPGATRRLVLTLLVTILAGGAALSWGDNQVRLALLACGVLAGIGFGLAAAGKHRTLGGQLWGVVGLSIPCVPILLAGEVPVSQALLIWMTWVLGFTSTTLAVRGVIAAQKKQPRHLHGTIVGLLMGVTTVLVGLRYPWVVASVPMLVMSVFLLVWPPPVRQIRRVGWSLVVGTVLTALGMIAFATTM